MELSWEQMATRLFPAFFCALVLCGMVVSCSEKDTSTARPAEKASVIPASVTAGVQPAPSNDKDVAIVLDSGEDAVSLVDLHEYKEISKFHIGKEPHHLMATPDDKYLIVANAVSNNLVFLDPHTGEIVKRIADISDPYQIGFSPDRKWFVSVSLRLHRVDIYDANDFHLIKRLKVNKAPSHLIFDANSTNVFVTLQDSDEIAAIRLSDQTLLWKMPVGKTPAGIRMTPDDKHLLVGIMGSNYVEVIDWREKKSVKKIVTAEGAHNFLPRGDGKNVFVSNRVAGKVCEVNEESLTVNRCFDVPGGPDCMEVTRDGTELWVTSRWVKKVHVIDIETGKMKKIIQVGRSPHGVYFFGHAART
jgi:DNA-binding beta-propeller fold protein YncE